MQDQNSWEDFQDYRIDTPTFELTPVEKPDMSPFLFHMTGRDEILSILSGEGREEALPENNGWLKSAVPESGGSGGYNVPVVCFTESPIFCLDFFRFRSFKRWGKDQRYGLGFKKAALVDIGVRPCVYAEQELCRQINRLWHNRDDINNKLSQLDDKKIASEFSDLITSIFPLTTRIGEQQLLQGFMWEREWRYPDQTGLDFHYKNIKIICCPPEEVEQIREVIGSYSLNVKFVNTWSEYNEVTDYLVRREQEHKFQKEENLSGKQLIALANTSIKQIQRSIYELDRYMQLARTFSERTRELEQFIHNLRQELSEREKQIKEMQEKEEDTDTKNT